MAPIRTGLPGGDVGRIVIAFSPAQKGLVYAKVESSGQPVALYASLDGGDSWERRGNVQAQPMYYKNIHADPKDPDRVYVPSVQTQISEDGGRTFRASASATSTSTTTTSGSIPTTPITCSKAATAACTRRGIAGGCGGTSPTSRSRSSTTSKSTTRRRSTTSTAARRTTARSDRRARGRPTAPPTATGSWSPAATAWARIDPTDPNIVYGESQHGGIVRLDRRTSERVSIKPVEGRGEAPLRFNWESPFVISPHNSSRRIGASRLFRSDDRGNSWRPVSPDLTRQTDRNQLPVMGRIWPPEAVAQHQSTATWGNISALTESRKREGMLITGTDDGVVQVSTGWRRELAESENLPASDYGTHGVYVQRLQASKIDENVVYSLYENTKNGDFKPTSTRAPIAAGAGIDCRDPAEQSPGARVCRRSRQPQPAVCGDRVRFVLHR